MTSPAIAAIRQRLNRFSCLQSAPVLTAAEQAALRQDLWRFNQLSDYQTLGVCSSTLSEGQTALEEFLQGLGITVSLKLPERNGAVYIKFNTLKGAWYLDSYTGPSRGVLVTFHVSEPEIEAVGGTYGPFPLDLYQDHYTEVSEAASS